MKSILVPTHESQIVPHIAAAAITSGDAIEAFGAIGIAQDTVVSGAVVMLHFGGQHKVTKASGAWVVNDPLFYDSGNSNFTTVADGNKFAGVARDAAASGDTTGNVLLMAWVALRSSSVHIKTADFTVLASQSGDGFTTVGAGGSVTFALPAAVVGLEYFYQVGAAQNLVLDPDASETVSLPSTGVAQATITANAIGETVHIKCLTAGTWAVFGFTGTWT